MAITIPEGGMHLEERTQTVIDSPGFAPLCQSTLAGAFEYEGKYYAPCTSLFNVLRTGRIRHTGIDLATGGRNEPIISLTYGKIWALTYDKEIVNTYYGSKRVCYGKIMLIKGLRDDKLYMLAHLEDYKRDVNEIVEPHDIVAIVGSTGYSTGEHVHIEVFKNVPDDKDHVLDTERYMEYPGADYITPTNPPKITRVNPFDHDEIYGLPRERWINR